MVSVVVFLMVVVPSVNVTVVTASVVVSSVVVASVVVPSVVVASVVVPSVVVASVVVVSVVVATVIASVLPDVVSVVRQVVLVHIQFKLPTIFSLLYTISNRNSVSVSYQLPVFPWLLFLNH